MRGLLKIGARVSRLYSLFPLIAMFCLLPLSVRAACTGSVPNLSAPDTGNTTTNMSNLQACVNTAAAASNQAITITVSAGVTYSGNLSIPSNLAGSNFITITTNGTITSTGTTIDESYSAQLAKFVTPNSSQVITFYADSHHWKFVGVWVTNQDAFPNGRATPFLIGGDGSGSTTYGHWPDSIYFDRCLIRPIEDDPIPYRSSERGIALDASNVSVVDSKVYNFAGWIYPSVQNTISSATNANPVVITMASPHGISASAKTVMYFTGATSGWAGLNGLKLVTGVGANTLSVQDLDGSLNATNLNSSGFGSFTGQSVSQWSKEIGNSIPISIGAGPGPYNVLRSYLQGYYAHMFFGGGGTWIDPANIKTVTAVNSLTSVDLNAIGTLQTGDLIVFENMQDQSISATSAGATTTITVPTMTFPAGTVLYPEGGVTISGYTGSWATLNGTRQATVVDSTHLSIAVDSSGFGAVTSSSPKWVPMVKNWSGTTEWSVARVTNISGTTVTYEWWGHQPDNTNGNGAGILVQNGSSVQFKGLNIHDVTVQQSRFVQKKYWVSLYRDVANTCNNCGSTSKGILESKQGENVLFDGCIFEVEGGDLAPNDGLTGIALNQANQVGSTPWVRNYNWTISNSIFKNYTYMILSLQEEYESGINSANVNFTNCLLTTSKGSFISINGGSGVSITHSTVRNLGGGIGYNAFIVVQGNSSGTIIKDNIGNWSVYGYVDFSTVWSPSQRNHNYYIDNASQSFSAPTGDFRVANDAAMLFVNVTSADAGGDYHGYQLQAGSPGKSAASDGTDVGVNFTTLDAALEGESGVLVCKWSSGCVSQ